MSEHKNIILQASASWCSPCVQAKRHIKAIGAEGKVVYIDVEENEALVAEYKIKNLPTFILLKLVIYFLLKAVADALNKLYNDALVEWKQQ